MFTRIFVPLDGSARAERALPVAARLARTSNGTVILASVVSPAAVYAPALAVPTDSQSIMEGESEGAKDYLARITIGDALTGIKTETVVGISRLAAVELIELAQAAHADVIVMCSHGRTGLLHWALGSVAQQSVRNSPIPVLVLKADGPIPAGIPTQPLRVLVALDGSSLAESALEPAAQLVAAFSEPGQGQLRLLQVIRYPILPYVAFAPVDASMQREIDDERTSLKERAIAYLHGVAQRFTQAPLADLRLQVSTAVVYDEDVAGAIAAMADGGQGLGEAVDVVAMATHGRTGLQRLAIGSITERALQATKRPLLIVRPAAAAAASEAAVERAGATAGMSQSFPAVPLF